jgi:4-amino-4-deoxy-L-arabinose transferase-like glycosyltransferase
MSAATATARLGRRPAVAGPLRRLWRGPAEDPRWARPALSGLLALTALLYLWDLSRNGYANDFYAAAVQAGTRSWKAAFFGSFDSASFITVDKTPASLWVDELSARMFGFGSWSLLAPQAVEGVLSVLLLFAAVRRWFGPAAGLTAGAVLALTPAAALIFRFNNPDALLVLLMTAAGYCVQRAIERDRTRWLVLAGALLGLGFLTKMMQAFLVLPGFGVAYLWAGPARLRRRLWQLLAGLGGMIAGAGWWIVIAELVPAAGRPYFGGSTNNNILQLALATTDSGGSTGRRPDQSAAALAAAVAAAVAAVASAGRPGCSGCSSRSSAGRCPG